MSIDQEIRNTFYAIGVDVNILPNCKLAEVYKRAVRSTDLPSGTLQSYLEAKSEEERKRILANRLTVEFVIDSLNERGIANPDGSERERAIYAENRK